MTSPSYTTLSVPVDYSEKGYYHIHVDASAISEDLHTQIKNSLFFIDDNFLDLPQKGYSVFVPKAHLSKKIPSKQEFDETWNILEKMVNMKNLTGYLEAEFIKNFDAIPSKPYIRVKPPFTIHRRTLNGSPNEIFRQSEIHIMMDADRSEKRLITDLLDAGFYGGYYQENDKKGVVLTIQGFTKDIEPLYKVLQQYLEKTGGAVNCFIEMELTVHSKLLGVTSNRLPEIADSVEYQ
jgi:hypothetical protein